MKNKPFMSVVINMHNMQREAKRTLWSLTTSYQSEISDNDYEVIVIDNGSTRPLNEKWVKSHGDHFRYIYVDMDSPSPAKAMNIAVKEAKGDWLVCCIDGARILSPGILPLMSRAIRAFEHPFIYTLGMHLGNKPQNFLLDEGYDQKVEDRLLEQVDWKNNGYELFDISCAALSCHNGYFSTFSESNAFCLSKDDYWSLGGFDEGFQSAGGGLVNLDFFNKVHDSGYLQPTLLLGEATFHQFHGGVATNVRMKQHPWAAMCHEYRVIRDKDFRSSYYPPFYFGCLQEQARRFTVMAN